MDFWWKNSTCLWFTYEIDESSAMKIKFFIDNVKVIYGSAKELGLDFADFSNFSFDYKSKKNESGQKECFGTIFYNEKKVVWKIWKFNEKYRIVVCKIFKKFYWWNLLSKISKAVDVAMSAGIRVAKYGLSEITSSKTIMLLTNKNDILAKQAEIDKYDFDDANEIFSAKPNEIYAGIVDIYNDENDDEFALAEKKIAKLKKMLDGGLISQEDFDFATWNFVASSEWWFFLTAVSEWFELSCYKA